MSKKEKDPAFLFYPQAWLEGTAEMSSQEKGIYIDLLAFQHQKGLLPNNIVVLARLTRVSVAEFEDVWRTLHHKFIIDGDSLYNDKLKREIARREFTARKNSIKGCFSSLLRKHKLESELYSDIKKDFDNDLFLDIPDENLQEDITNWFLEYCEIWYGKTSTKRQLKVNHG